MKPHRWPSTPSSSSWSWTTTAAEQWHYVWGIRRDGTRIDLHKLLWLAIPHMRSIRPRRLVLSKWTMCVCVFMFVRMFADKSVVYGRYDRWALDFFVWKWWKCRVLFLSEFSGFDSVLRSLLNCFAEMWCSIDCIGFINELKGLRFEFIK